MGNQQPFRAAPTELGGMGDAFCYDISRLTALAIRRLAGLAFQQNKRFHKFSSHRPVQLGARFHTKQAAQRTAATATHHSGHSFI